jgi:hypothetical protein
MTKPVFWVGAAIAGVLLLLTVLTGLFWMNSRATAAALADHGAVAIATVDGKRIEHRRVRTNDGTRRETDYLVTYAFDAVSPQGETIPQAIEREVPRSVFDGLRTGDEVEIRYLPEDPSQADFYPGQSAGSATVLGWAMAVMLASTLGVLGFTVVVTRAGRPGPETGPIQSA